ncbi:MAG: hypothetical protein RL274_930 [Pseudomonadota bacterium]|jgi:hypothetical protein
MTKYDYDLFVIGGGLLPFACVSAHEGEVLVAGPRASEGGGVHL